MLKFTAFMVLINLALIGVVVLLICELRQKSNANNKRGEMIQALERRNKNLLFSAARREKELDDLKKNFDKNTLALSILTSEAAENKKNATTEQTFSVAQAAKYARLTASQILDAIKSNGLLAKTVKSNGSKIYKILKTDLDIFLEKRESQIENCAKSLTDFSYTSQFD